MRVHKYLDEWEIHQRARRLAAVTISERIRVVSQFGHEIDQQAWKADALTISRWIASHDEWSDSTTATYHSYLGAWFKWLQVQDHRLDNPMVKVGTPKYPDREPRPVSDGDLVRLLTTRMRRRTRVMILLAALAGLRVHEIAKVRGEDIVDAKALRVTGKGGKVRSVPLHPMLIAELEHQPTRGYWFESHRSPGRHVLAKSVSDIIGQAMRRAGIAGTPHSLRHWYGTALLSNGADLRTVQELMRHSSIASTQGYTKVPDERRRWAVGTLNPYQGAA